MIKEYILNRKDVRNRYIVYFIKHFLWLIIIDSLFLMAIISFLIYAIITKDFSGDKQVFGTAVEINILVIIFFISQVRKAVSATFGKNQQ